MLTKFKKYRMSSFFDSLFKWFKTNDEEKKESIGCNTTDIFADQKKACFDFYGPCDNYYQRRYISCETQTDKIDFLLSPFDTEPPPKKEIKESKHHKYCFKNQIKMDENFKFEFKFNNTEKPTSKKAKPPAFQTNFNLDYNNQNSEHRTIETESQINRSDQSEFQNQPGDEDQQQSENQSYSENQQETESQSGSQSGSENRTETETHSGYEEEDYDSKTDTET